jgi:hypothetical protein
MNKFPVVIDTLSTKTKKLALEKQITELESAIALFSKPKILVKC